MKTRIKRVLGVIVGVVLLGYLIICSTYMLRGYTRLFGFYELKRNSVDVFLVGTSVTFTSFMPMEAWNDYGIVAYDYCTNMQFENSLRYSIADIEKTQNPKLIMIDIAPFLYEHYAGNEKWDEADRELFIKYNLDSRKYNLDRFALVNEINQDKRGSITDYFYYFFDISRYHTNTYVLEHFDNAEKDITRGYGYLGHNKGQIFTEDNAVTDDGRIVSINEREQFYLDKLLETAESIDGDVLFYCAPIYFWEEDQFGKKNYLKEYIESEGFTFVDFSKDIKRIGIDCDTDLWSANHFDSLGAEKVTRFLCEYIIENYNIPDRRCEMEYSEMFSDYSEWYLLKKQYEEADRNDLELVEGLFR